MKANELMIGDWVLYNETHQQILEISGIDDEVYLETDELVHQSEIQPIPLTPEILVKNGFEVRDYTDDMEYFYKDGYEVMIIFDEGFVIYKEGGEVFDEIPPSIFLVIKFAEKSLRMPIEYVHELQQAMRIMGCDKEIEL